MCSASYQKARLKKTASGCTSTTRPAWMVNPPGRFIQPFAATTDAVPPAPDTTTGRPLQKWVHGRRRFHP